MKRTKILLLALSVVFLFSNIVLAQNVRSTFGNKDSTNIYAIEEKSDDIVYFRPSGGYKEPYEKATTSDTLTAAETGKTVVVSSSTPATFTLPTAAVGASFRFISNTNKVFYVDPQSTDTIVWSVSSQPMAAGDKLESPGATGDSVELFCAESGTWNVAAMRGNFVDGN